MVDQGGQLKRFMEDCQMFSKFFNIEPEKQDRIINAAIKVFAQEGYQNASTNEIVKEAGISKGLLFHYFRNKKGLYLFLYDHLLGIFMVDISEKIDWSDKDIFSRYRQVASIKFGLFQKYPEMFNFIKAVYKENSNEVKSDLERKNKDLLAESYQKLFSDVDFSKFKEGIDINKALKVIFWTMEGFAYQQQDKAMILDLDEVKIGEVIAEMDMYFEILKKSFYK